MVGNHDTSNGCNTPTRVVSPANRRTVDPSSCRLPHWIILLVGPDVTRYTLKCHALQYSCMASDETTAFLAELYNQAAKEDESPKETAQRINKNLRGLSRRDLMKASGGVGLGAILGGGSIAATQGAGAQPSTSDSDGNVGIPSDRVDVFSDGINANSIDTEALDITDIFETAADDAELSAALSNASEGNTILLANADFTSDYTFDTRGVAIEGTEVAQTTRGTSLSGSLAFNDRTLIEAVDLSSTGGFSVGNQRCTFDGCSFGVTVTVSADEVSFISCADGSVTFESGTSGGLVDSCRNVSVTDNGTNTVGDIS